MKPAQGSIKVGTAILIHATLYVETKSKLKMRIMINAMMGIGKMGLAVFEKTVPEITMGGIVRLDFKMELLYVKKYVMMAL